MNCPAPVHGTARAWQAHRCTCPGARDDYNRQQRLARKRRQLGHPGRVPATVTHRQIRDLMTAGWTARQIAVRIGWACGELDSLLRRPTVYRKTAARVQAVYDEMRPVAGPSEITRRRAAKAEWWLDPPPAGPIVDEVAVERAMNGDPEAAGALTRAERREAVRVLHGRGWLPTQIGLRLRMSGHSVNAVLANVGTVAS